MLFKCAVMVLVVAGCGRCNSVSEVGGETPYERCLDADPPSFPANLGKLKFTLADRVLEIHGLPPEPRVAVFQGPGMATGMSSTAALAALTAQTPDLLLMLGGLGTDAKTAATVLGSVAEVGVPVLFLAGGRDRANTLAEGRETLPDPLANRVLDTTALVGVRVHAYFLLLLAGAAGGQDGIADDSCGFSEADIEPRLDAAKTAASRSRVVIVSWAIPAGPLGGSDSGVSIVGSGLIAGLQADLGVVGGLHAWPDHQVMRPLSKANQALGWGVPVADLQLVVPRLIGPSHQRADGTRQTPGFAIIRLAKAGLIAEAPR